MITSCLIRSELLCTLSGRPCLKDVLREAVALSAQYDLTVSFRYAEVPYVIYWESGETNLNEDG